MGLLKKLFGGAAGAKPGGGASSQFVESETTAQRTGSVNAPRRELVQVVLRDTMRKHAIPSDWIDCRILSVVTRKHQAGMHVQFIVRQGEEKLLPYVHAFQDTFWSELEKFEAHPREWLFSLAWQFDGDRRAGAMMGLDDWDGDTQPPQETPGMPPPHAADAEELASDLQALYAIRDAALSQPAELAPSPRKKPARS
jgi:hypothetical protein